MKVVHLWRDALHQAQRVLPMVLVAAAAAGTWWLVQSGVQKPRTVRDPVAATVPDLVLHGAVVERFDVEGRLVARILGQRMQHYKTEDLLQIEALDAVLLDRQQHTLLATARQGRYAQQDQKLVLEGAVRVTDVAQGQDVSQAMVFRGEELSWDDARRRISANRPVTLTSPRGVVRGSSLDHDLDTRISELGGRVDGQLKGSNP